MIPLVMHYEFESQLFESLSRTMIDLRQLLEMLAIISQTAPISQSAVISLSDLNATSP